MNRHTKLEREPRRLRAVWRRRRSARSPLEVFRALQAARPAARIAFLHSGGNGGAAGRYSLIAHSPDDAFCVAPETPDDPFELLRRALGRHRWAGGARPEAPFFGGWVGMFSYDLAHRVERLRTAARVDHGFPLMHFEFYRNVLAYDREEQTWTACRLTTADEASADEALEDALDEALAAPLPERDAAPALAGELSSNFTREDYEAAVRRALEYILAGDIYQVNLSQRFTGRLRISPAELALRLFESSPAPFAAFLPCGEGRWLVSSSPERFLRLRDRAVETCPIKGTRPRGQTPREDARLRDELLASEKERAELTMIADLLRNDLGRVCEYGSVRVEALRELASFANVHHTFSRIVGRLRPGADTADLLRATLPGGSVTGAPKVRAMEIVEELEPTARGPYCGAIGYLGVDGALDLNIAIRTMLVEGDRLTFQVGGGIVADSRPAAEYEETLHKAQGMLQALGA